MAAELSHSGFLGCSFEMTQTRCLVGDSIGFILDCNSMGAAIEGDVPEY